jgi:hypothetical protein
MMRSRSPGGVTECIHLAEKLHSAIPQLDQRSPIPKIVSLTTSANRWLSSLHALVQEIRQKDALCLTQNDAKRKAEPEAVISTLTYGMNETIGWLSDGRHLQRIDAAEKIKKRVDLHWMSVSLISAYLKRCIANNSAMIASTRLIVLVKGIFALHAFRLPRREE